MQPDVGYLIQLLLKPYKYPIMMPLKFMILFYALVQSTYSTLNYSSGKSSTRNSSVLIFHNILLAIGNFSNCEVEFFQDW